MNAMTNTNTETLAPDPKERVRTVRPRVDILVGDDGFRIVGDFPGVRPEDFDVHVDGNKLVLEGRARHGADEPTTLYRRAFVLPGTTDAARLEAHLENGVLTLHLPKVASARRRKVPVEVV